MKLPRNIAEAAYWTSQRLRGRAAITERLAFLRESQYWDPHAVRTFQMEKLRIVLEHAYLTVPHYRSVFQERGLTPADITSLGDLCKLPLLDRPTLLREGDRLLSSAADHETLVLNYSSGSTGVRAEFKQDDDFRLWMRAHQLRTYEWCGRWRLGEPFLLLWGSEIYWSLKSVTDRVDNALTNRREYNTFRLTPQIVDDFVSRIARFGPVLISSYSNAMHLIAQAAERRGTPFPSVRAVQGTSEPISPEMRERIGRIFSCEVFDKYGSRETNVVAHESPNHEQMCIQAENVIVEIIDHDGRACPPGRRGRLVLTTLNNLSMPLIRYETHDIAAFVDGTCSSGIGLPRMTSVAGRLQDLIYTPDGVAIDSYFFSYLLMRFPAVHWFQVVQRETESLVIRAYAPGGFPLNVREQITRLIETHTGFTFRIEFDVLDAMPESATGKFRLCVSELERVPRSVAL